MQDELVREVHLKPCAVGGTIATRMPSRRPREPLVRPLPKLDVQVAQERRRYVATYDIAANVNVVDFTTADGPRDGAVVVSPLSNDAHYLLFRFPNQTF